MSSKVSEKQQGENSEAQNSEAQNTEASKNQSKAPPMSLEDAAKLNEYLKKYKIGPPQKIKKAADLYNLKQKLEYDLTNTNSGFLYRMNEMVNDLKEEKFKQPSNELKKELKTLFEINNDFPKTINDIDDYEKKNYKINDIQQLEKSYSKGVINKFDILKKTIDKESNEKEAEIKKVGNLILKLWTLYSKIDEKSKISEILKNVNAKNEDKDNKDIVKNIKNLVKDMQKKIDDEFKVLDENDYEGIKEAKYKTYIENLTKLMISDKKQKIEDLIKIG